MSSYLNYTDPSGNEVEVLESLKGWIIDPNTQAQKTIENYENQRLSIEDAIESGLLNNRAGQIFLDYGDVIMGPPVTLPSSLVGIREAIKGNSDSEEMQRTATAGFYAGFVGQGLEYVQIISKADYQLSLLIVTQKDSTQLPIPLHMWSISGTSHHRRNWKRQREPQRVHGKGNMILHSAGKPELQYWITFWWR